MCAAQSMYASAFFGLILGTALQLQQNALWSGWAYASMLLACFTYAIHAVSNKALKRPRLRLLICLFACAALGFATAGLRSLHYASGALDPNLEGRDLLVTGVVADLPQVGATGLRFRMEVSEATRDGTPVPTPPLIDVVWYGGVYALGNEQVGLQRPPEDVRAGQRWRMLVRMKAPHGASNPSGFDYELWLWEQGVGATAYVRAGPADPAPQLLEITWQYPVDVARHTLRDRIVARVEPASAAGLIAALVVGDQRAIDRQEWDVYRVTGVAHLMSISGLHITMFAWAATGLVGWLWRRSGRLCLRCSAPAAALSAGLLLATAYAVFSGWGVPAQRTCLMLATVGALRLLGLRGPWPQVWLLACAVVVVSDPWALLQAGFWLSFVAVGVLFASGRPQTASGTQQPRGNGLRGAARWAIGHFKSMCREQWTITIALAPLTLVLFGQFSLVGMFANLVAIPWVTLVITPLSMAGVLLPAAWDWAAVAITLMTQVLHWLATMPLASILIAAAPLWIGVAAVIGGTLLAVPLPWHLRVMGVALVLPLLLWKSPAPVAGQFDLLAADIGQGNAVLVRTASHALLYDAGPRYSPESDAGHRVLVPLLQALGVGIDMLVLSHRDTDHTGGAPALLTMYPQAQLLSSIADDHPLQSIRTARRCEAGQAWEWDGVQFQVLHPRRYDYGKPLKPNAMSCVLRITAAAYAVDAGRDYAAGSAGGHAVGNIALLVGDIEAPQEQRLVASGENLHADVLLVPHHGSKTSSTPEFLEAVNPSLALVQSGYRNRFGHPAPPVVARYAEHGIRLVDSPHCGAMRWSSDRPTEVQCQRELHLRYWHHRPP